MSHEIRIYVADLATYNAGHLHDLHGAWIDACDDVSDIWKQINTMLAASPVKIQRNTRFTIMKGLAAML